MTTSSQSPFEFVPYEALGESPNIIVDGAPNDFTVLTLSHWPKSGTPIELKRDTSAEIAFAYLDTPTFHRNVDVISNNHFDEDGLVGLFTLLDPQLAQKNRELLIEVGTAGDFCTYTNRAAARVVFVLSAFADPTVSPLAAGIFQDSYAGMTAQLYQELLPALPDILERLNDYRKYWEAEDAHLSRSEAYLENGTIEIEERADVDLAIVRIPDDLPNERTHRFTNPVSAACHPFAICNRTTCNRLVLVQGQCLEMQYRYESWLQFVSRPISGRVDLTGLCDQLNGQEKGAGRWVFDGVEQIDPKLHLQDATNTSIDTESVISKLCDHLGKGPVAWNPADD